MHGHVGDRIVIRSSRLGRPARDGEIVGLQHDDGRPPYQVRWSDNGHESLFFPGPDARIEPFEADHAPPVHAM